MRNMTANILLSRAAKYITRYGLTKDELAVGEDVKDSDRPAVCANGALIVAKYGTKALNDIDFPDDSKFNNAIVRSAIKKIGRVLGDPDFEVRDLADWNDSPNTTKAEVVATFRAAIKA